MLLIVVNFYLLDIDVHHIDKDFPRWITFKSPSFFKSMICDLNMSKVKFNISFQEWSVLQNNHGILYIDLEAWDLGVLAKIIWCFFYSWSLRNSCES